jgi:NADH:ubiquinone oxidoreductase subunit 6 (subunit J)
MKHVFYVIYVLFYTGAVFVTGLFVGQLLERSWAARRGSAQAPSRHE